MSEAWISFVLISQPAEKASRKAFTRRRVNRKALACVSQPLSRICGAFLIF
jgi:hypothetical protein